MTRHPGAIDMHDSLHAGRGAGRLATVDQDLLARARVRGLEHGEPLFLDEPPDAPRPPIAAILLEPDLFLDEGDPSVWGAGPLAHSPLAGAHGEARVAPSLWSRIRSRTRVFSRPTFPTVFAVALTVIVILGVTAYGARELAPDGFWRSLRN